MGAYYNEVDPFAAEWLRNLVKEGLVAPGEVDERDIREVRPEELQGYEQVHLFAGIGGWSLAARLAGWPDDRPLWTGSCPCQPFSTAKRGRGGKGLADERHLWPQFFRLVQERRPPLVVGEQVASQDGLLWLDQVRADLEGTDYAFGAVDLCASALGYPPRKRLYFVAESDLEGERHGPFDGQVAGLQEAEDLVGSSWRELRGVGPAGHGVPPGMGRLHSYGNAVVPQVAAEFLRAIPSARR